MAQNYLKSERDKIKVEKRKQATITITQTGYYDRPNDKRMVLLTEGQVLNVKWFHGDMTSYLCWLGRSR